MNQKQVWDKIAPEWNKFRDKSDEKTINFVKNQKGKLLDLGCGTGRHFTKTKTEIYAIDFSENMIKFAKKKAKGLKIKKIKFFVSPAISLPFENNFFDAAICTAVLHCIPTKKDRVKTLKELYRALKPKAKLRITVWNKENTRFKNKPKESLIDWRGKGKRYYYFYTEEELKKELEKAGFRINFQKSKIDNTPHYSITFIVEK